MDTVYAKLLARGEKTTKLYTLIEESKDIVLEEVESEFLTQGQFNALSKLYGRAGAVEKQLELWSKYAAHFSESDHALKPTPVATELQMVNGATMISQTPSRTYLSFWRSTEIGS